MGKTKIQSKKTIVDGIEFDSQLEADYYKELKIDPLVEEIILQPQFQVFDDYTVLCKRCNGNGQTLNQKTSNYNKCSLCKGKGKRTKRGTTYTADFHVYYKDAYEEVVDVKGFANERFPYIRKMFESKYGIELIVITRKRGEWVRK